MNLGGFAYGSGLTSAFTPAASMTSGTLIVIDGSQQTTLTLIGTYATSNLALAYDHAGGTLVKFT